VENEQNACRLRAVVQHLNIKFAERMRQRGHKYEIKTEAETNEDASYTANEPLSLPNNTRVGKTVSSIPRRLTRNQAVQWVIQILQRSRRRELPGTFNPMLISHLF
jgi:hypothetical protein